MMDIHGDSDTVLSKSNNTSKNTILIILLAVTTSWATLNYIGFCFKKFSFISDEQKIRIAVAEVLKIKTTNLKSHYDQPSTYFYNDVDDFLNINKDCCSVSGSEFWGGEWFEWADRLCGNLSDYVYVSEPSKYKDKAMIPDSSIYIFAISNCGNIRSPSF